MSFVRNGLFAGLVVAAALAFHSPEAKAQYYYPGSVQVSWNVPYSSGTVIAPAPVYAGPVYSPVVTSHYHVYDATPVYSAPVYSSRVHYSTGYGSYGSSSVVVSAPYSTTRIVTSPVVTYSPVIVAPLPPPPPVFYPAPVVWYGY